MTFLPTATFDENGELELLTGEKKKRGHMQYTQLGKETVTSADVQTMTVTEAEELVLGTDFGMLSNPPQNGPETADEKRAAKLKRAGANVATKAGRAAGNTILYNSADAERVLATAKILNEGAGTFGGVNLGQIAGGTQVVGIPPSTGTADDDDGDEKAKPRYEYIEENRLPEGKALVMYRNTDSDPGDNAFIYIEDQGLIVNERYAPVDKYGIFVRL